jgi:hypothetical protein
MKLEEVLVLKYLGLRKIVRESLMISLDFVDFYDAKDIIFRIFAEIIY